MYQAADELGIPYEIQELENADVTNDKGTFIAERKGFLDFWSSMVDKRVYQQTQKMYSQYKDNRYVFVETGTLADLAFERKKDTNWIYSLFGEIENWDVKFREYVDINDLMLKLYWLDQKLGEERQVREVEIKLYGLTDAQKALSQFPGIGKEKAKAILSACKTFLSVIGDLYGTQEVLDSIHGIKKDGKILNNLKEKLEELHD